jgi:hypothetical protein
MPAIAAFTLGLDPVVSDTDAPYRAAVATTFAVQNLASARTTT